MIAELYHKTSSNEEDELTGNFFGALRYISFQTGLKRIFLDCVCSEDKSLVGIINQINEESWNESIKFWKRSDLDLGEIDVYLEFDSVVIGIEVKLYSGLSSEDQLEREADMLTEWGNNKKKILLFIASEADCKMVYQEYKDIIAKKMNILFGYLSWESILEKLRKYQSYNQYEMLVFSDLAELLSMKGFDVFTDFNNIEVQFSNDTWHFSCEGEEEYGKTFKGDRYLMNTGKNIHIAFQVVYDTYKSVEKLMAFCESRADDKYYLPAKRFLRHSGDTDWTGWIYWSFILLFQRRADGVKMEHNSWINAPVYAVEINLDSDTCEEPQLIIAKFEYSDLIDWSPGCSPASFDKFYNPIHKVKLFDSKIIGDYEIITPTKGMEKKVSDKYWSLKQVTLKVMPLTEVNKDNAYDKIFQSMEELSLL